VERQRLQLFPTDAPLILAGDVCMGPIHCREFSNCHFAISLSCLWFAAEVGDAVRWRIRPLPDRYRPDVALVLTAILTLLGLER
jgi:hypothetical protein